MISALVFIASLVAAPMFIQSAYTSDWSATVLSLTTTDTIPGSLVVCTTPTEAIVLDGGVVFRSDHNTHYTLGTGSVMKIVVIFQKTEGYAQVMCSEYTGVQVDGLGKPMLYHFQSPIIKPIPFSEIWRRFWSDR